MPHVGIHQSHFPSFIPQSHLTTKSNRNFRISMTIITLSPDAMTPTDIATISTSPTKMDKNKPASDKSSPKKKKTRRRPRKNSDDKTSKRKRRNSNGKSNNSSKKVPEPTQEEKSRYVALDCEMVGVGYGGYRSALARVCIIDWEGNTLMDDYVRPSQPVTDYRTFVSGITQEHLESEDALELEHVRSKAQHLLEDKILVGHALKNDLHALNITHPWYDIRDTGKYEPFMKTRFDDGILWPRKLKDLAKEKLGLDVQAEGIAHSPYEDAHTAMELYKLVRRKWEKAMEYKRNRTLQIQKEQQLVDSQASGQLQVPQ